MNTNIRIITKSGKEIDYISPENLNLKLNRVVDDLINPDSRFGEYSYTFSLPMTDNNVSIFEYAGVPNITNNFKANPIECIITDDDKLIINGILELRAITTTYDVVMYSVFTQLIDSIKDKSLQDIKSLPHIHDFKYEDTIREHINADYKNSDEANWQFPFVFYNTVYTPTNVFSGTTDQNGVAFRRDNTKQNYYNILNNTDNVDPNEMYFHQFPLAWYLKPVIEGILADAGWTMGGSFFEDENIKKIIMPYVGDSDIYDTATYCTPTGDTTTTTTTLAPSTTTTTTATPVPTTTTTTTLAPTGTTTTSTTTTTLAPTGTTTTTSTSTTTTTLAPITTTTTTMALVDYNLLAGTDALSSDNLSSDAYSISNDGINWYGLDTPTTLWGSKPCWDGSKWIISGFGGSDISYSSNGFSWTALGDLGSSYNQGIEIAFNGWQYIAINKLTSANEGSNVTRLLTSSDGITWTPYTHTVLNDVNVGTSLVDIIWQGDRWYLIGNSSTGNKLSTSINGIDWVRVSRIGGENFTGIVYGNGMFLISLAGDTNTNKLYKSTNGSTWSAVTLSNFNFMHKIGFNGTYFCALGSKSTATYLLQSGVSTDGVNWTTNSFRFDGDYNIANFSDIIFDTALGIWIASYWDGKLGTNKIMTSTDGLDWSIGNGSFGYTYGISSKHEYGVINYPVVYQRQEIFYFGFSTTAQGAAYSNAALFNWVIQGSIYLDPRTGKAYTTNAGTVLATQGWYQSDNQSTWNGYEVSGLGVYSTYNTAIPTTTTTTTLPPAVAFNLTSACQGITSNLTINSFANGSGLYQANTTPQTSIANAFAGTFMDVTTQYVYTGVANGTWYVVVRDKNNTSNGTYHVITTSCVATTTSTTTTTLAPTTTTTTSTTTIYQRQAVTYYGSSDVNMYDAYADAVSGGWSAQTTIYLDARDGIAYTTNAGTFIVTTGWYQINNTTAYNGYEINGSGVYSLYNVATTTTTTTTLPARTKFDYYGFSSSSYQLAYSDAAISGWYIKGSNYLAGDGKFYTTPTGSTISPAGFYQRSLQSAYYGSEVNASGYASAYNYAIYLYQASAYSCVEGCGTIILSDLNVASQIPLTVNRYYWDSSFQYWYRIISTGGVGNTPITFDTVGYTTCTNASIAHCP